METTHKETVINFIEEIWNQNRFEKIGNYMAPGFIDHSLPPALPANTDGMKLWIIGTGKAFVHQTIIDDMVCEDNKVMLKITMQLKHIGIWRDIAPTHIELSSTGYRYFKLSGNKILEHYALIDGNAIENQLRKASHGCKVQA